MLERASALPLARLWFDSRSPPGTLFGSLGFVMQPVIASRPNVLVRSHPLEQNKKRNPFSSDESTCQRREGLSLSIEVKGSNQKICVYITIFMLLQERQCPLLRDSLSVPLRQHPARGVLRTPRTLLRLLSSLAQMALRRNTIHRHIR